MEEESEIETTYEFLKKIQQGVEFTYSESGNFDDLIRGVKFNKGNPSKSMVEIYFDSDRDYFELFDLGDDDLWFLERLFSPYGDDLGFYNYDTADDDWDYGYILMEFDDENQSKVLEIINFFRPGIKTIDNSNSELISDILKENFSRQVDRIIDDYYVERDSCMSRSAYSEIKNDLQDVLTNYGILMKTSFTSYLTTVSVLISLYEMVGDYSLTIKELLKTILENIPKGPYYEYMYEYGCDDFDYDSFNRSVSYQLERINDVIERGDEFVDIEEFKRISQYIYEKFYFQKWIPLKDKNINLFISHIDPGTNKLVVQTQKPFDQVQTRMLTLEEFHTLLYNLELFERRILKNRKKV